MTIRIHFHLAQSVGALISEDKSAFNSMGEACPAYTRWLFVQSEPSSNLTQSLEGIPGER